VNSEENNPDMLLEELDPEWVNHWHEDKDKKETNTKQLTF
jgi:hypothetical protein